MLQYPQELKTAAQSLLNNTDFQLLISHKLGEIREDIVAHIEDKEILGSHAEFNHLTDFVNWVKEVSEHGNPLKRSS